MKTRICVPVMGSCKEDILLKAEEIGKTDAELVEWRYDALKTPVILKDTVRDLKKLLPGKELLFTVRTLPQGGLFRGDEREYVTILKDAIISGIDLIDIETCLAAEEKSVLMDMARSSGVAVIESFHDFQKTPSCEEILKKLEEMNESGADYVKTAYMPEKPSDTAAVLLATALFTERHGERAITMSMGKIGQVSRISGEVFGSQVTFSSVSGQSAPGQMEIGDVRRIMEILR